MANDELNGYSIGTIIDVASSFQEKEAREVAEMWEKERKVRLAFLKSQGVQSLEEIVRAVSDDAEDPVEKLAAEIADREAKAKAEIAAVKKFPPPPTGGSK